MRKVIIGDIRGRTNWRDIIKKNGKECTYIFLGNYFNPFTKISTKDLCTNFTEILKYKYDYDNIQLLVGNLDIAYVSDVAQCEYNHEVKMELGDTFRNGIIDGEFKVVLNYDDIWISNAGISKCWFDNHKFKLSQAYINEEFYSEVERNTLHRFGFIDGEYTDYYGNNIWQGPLWIGYKSLISSPIEGIRQIVGHTPCNENTSNNDIIRADCLEFNKYYILNNNNIKQYEL
jgi:hypothetical protein